MDQYIGKMLDNRYEILECIGTGGMAVVYKARCHRLNRLVAVKILKPELASDAEFRRRFHDESQAVAMLSHSNIVAVYDVSRSDDLDYIVMELIDGLTLKQYMQKRGAPLNWREALHFITQIVRALGHAHSRGIIHRDIKPQNILVLRDGNVKVTDFGIARVASAAQTTLTQEALGSVHYISPEQARGSHIDGRSDLYSAGVVLYEMLTGRLPFEGETPVSIAIQHINSIPIPPRDLNPGIPPTLEAITLKAMAPKPENRYSSADDMLADLEEFRKNPDAALPGQEQKENDLLDEPTRVVPVSEIKQEAQRTAPQRQNAAQRGKQSRPSESYSGYGDYDEEEPKRKGVPPFLIAVLAILVFVGGMIFFVYNFLFKGILQKPQVYTVPNVQIYTIDQLQNNPELIQPFRVEVEEWVYSDEVAQGNIISQTPEKDTVMEDGADLVITVKVSAGEETVYLPDFTNQDSRKVSDELNKMGLIIDPQYEFHDDITSNRVIRTIPVANTPVKAGDTVTVVISNGKETEKTMVPNFIGMDINRAKSMVDMRGLNMGEVKEFYDETYPAGQIMFQSIDADTEVEKGTSISFQVSLGPEPKPSEEPSLPPSESIPPDPQPSNTNVIAVTKNIEVNLSAYSGAVHIQVMVGGNVCYDGSVNASAIPTLSVPVSGIGVQRVEIYVNGTLVRADSVNFDE